jgi:murein DD-endopeptidase MepM/ murein hydrolase activator NlpD
MKTTAILGCVVVAGCMALAARAHAEAALEVRFCPAKVAHTYPLQDTAKVQGLLLQNIAVINHGPSPATLKAVEIDLMDAGRVADARRFDGAALDAAAKSGGRVQASGQMQAFAFQFCDGALLSGADVTGSTVLAPGAALMVSRQFFAWRGARDQAQVKVEAEVDGKALAAQGAIPIDGAGSKTVLRFPLKGRWFVAVSATPHGGHRWALPEEFAFDIVQLGPDTQSHSGDGTAFAQYFAYGAPVMAAADGVVVSAVGDQPEDLAVLRRPGEPFEAYMEREAQLQAALILKGPDAVAGNNVVMDHGNGEFSLYAHLKPGSLTVKVGQKVKAGDVIGQLGSSGNATEPHLHFQLCDGRGPLSCAGIPMNFTGVDLPLADGPRAIQAGDIVVSE